MLACRRNLTVGNVRARWACPSRGRPCAWWTLKPWRQWRTVARASSSPAARALCRCAAIVVASSGPLLLTSRQMTVCP